MLCALYYVCMYRIGVGFLKFAIRLLCVCFCVAIVMELVGSNSELRWSILALFSFVLVIAVLFACYGFAMVLPLF